MSDPGLILVAEVHGLAGLERSLRNLIDGLAAGSRDEPDCLSYRILSADGPGAFVLLSEWTGETALRAHYDTRHYRHYRDNVGPLLARPSDVVVHHVRDTLHPRDPYQPDPGRGS